jgi:hypothetical protein
VLARVGGVAKIWTLYGVFQNGMVFQIFLDISVIYRPI